MAQLKYKLAQKLLVILSLNQSDATSRSQSSKQRNTTEKMTTSIINKVTFMVMLFMDCHSIPYCSNQDLIDI
jgi:hypothetical protein